MKTTINTSLILSCTKLLIKKQLSIAFAESATAGRLASEFALAPDAGKFLKGGIVCYDAKIKQDLLGVPEGLIKSFSPESEIVTCSITSGLQHVISADIHIGCTGLTSPGGSETFEKPVGTMFLYGVIGNRLLFSDKKVFHGSPEDIILQTVNHTALLLNQYLMINEPDQIATLNLFNNK